MVPLPRALRRRQFRHQGRRRQIAYRRDRPQLRRDLRRGAERQLLGALLHQRTRRAGTGKEEKAPRFGEGQGLLASNREEERGREIAT